MFASNERWYFRSLRIHGSIPLGVLSTAAPKICFMESTRLIVPWLFNGQTANENREFSRTPGSYQQASIVLSSAGFCGKRLWSTANISPYDVWILGSCSAKVIQNSASFALVSAPISQLAVLCCCPRPHWSVRSKMHKKASMSQFVSGRCVKWVSKLMRRWSNSKLMFTCEDDHIWNTSITHNSSIYT